MSELDYAGWKKEMGEAPPKEGATTPAPAPAQDTAPAATEAAPTQAATPAKPEAQAAEKEPFAGFSDLSPEAQAQFRRLTGERDDFKLRYTRQLGEYRRVVRQGSGQPSQPGRGSAHSQPSDTMDQARVQVANLAPSAQRTAIQTQLDKWQEHATKYPEDAAAINQRVDALRDELAQGYGPMARELESMKAELQQLRGFSEAVQAERHQRVTHEAQQVLTDVAGDNWRHVVGWEDAEGRPIPVERQALHPEFVAWIEGHDPDMQEFYRQQLEHRSPQVVGQVIAAFNRDRFGLESGGQQNGHATSDPVMARRAEALRDVQPGAARAKVSGPNTWAPTGDPYADAIQSGYDEWRKNTR